MNSSILDLSPAQLRHAAALKEKIDALQRELVRLVGAPSGGATASLAAPKSRRMSAASIAKISRAAKARWAKIKAARPAGGSSPKKRHMSAATKAKLAAVARARWKKAKASGKMAL